MRSGVHLKRPLLALLLPALALACALPVATANAHGRHALNWHHGYWRANAVVAGTVTTVGSGSFSASAYVVTPGPGNSGKTPATTTATILTGSTTKVITYGQSGITAGDDFYAVYRSVPSSTPLSTLESDTPAVVYAFAPPTPEVEVKGVVTTAPASGSDTFTATAYMVAPPIFHHWPVLDPISRVNNDAWGDRYSYGGNVGGKYGFTPATSGSPGTCVRTAGCLPGSTPDSQGMPGTVITTDGSTKVAIDGQPSSVSSLAVGDKFTATFDGTPSESLSTITATPALWLSAWAPPTPKVLYAFVGTVSSHTMTSVSVNVTSSIPSGLFTGTDMFNVGSTTLVLGNSSSSIFGSLSSVTNGDVVAGGLVGPSGQSASTIESEPLQVLVDFPMSSSSSTVSASAKKRAERRALRLLHNDKVKLLRHQKRRRK